MNCQEARDVGALFDPAQMETGEQDAVAAHLMGCPDCRQEVARQRAILDLLPFGLLPVAPPAHLKGLLVRRIAIPSNPNNSDSRDLRISDPPGARSVSRYWLLLTPAWPIVAAILAGVTVWQFSQVGDRDRRIASLAAAAARDRTRISFLKSRTAQEFQMVGDFSKSELAARVFWDPGRKALLLIVQEVPPPPEGKTYQLWFIDGERKISGGLFSSNLLQEGSWQVSVPTRQFDATALTLEPETGVLQPTGPIVLLGKPYSPKAPRL